MERVDVMHSLALPIAMLSLGIPVAPLHAEEWEGGIAGVTVGYNWIEEDSSQFSILALPISPPVPGSNHGAGPSLGGMIGYRADLNGFVLGGEIDADWSDAKFEIGTTAGGTATQTRWQGSVRAVAGVPIGRTLIFATGGLGVARTSHSARTGVGVPEFRWSGTPTGWVAGGGVELALGSVRPRLEYRHSDYGTTETLVNSTVYFRRRVSSDSIRLSAVFAF
jgi:outer membrane immunogenic protein